MGTLIFLSGQVTNNYHTPKDHLVPTHIRPPKDRENRHSELTLKGYKEGLETNLNPLTP